MQTISSLELGGLYLFLLAPATVDIRVKILHKSLCINEAFHSIQAGIYYICLPPNNFIILTWRIYVSINYPCDRALCTVSYGTYDAQCDRGARYIFQSDPGVVYNVLVTTFRQFSYDPFTLIIDDGTTPLPCCPPPCLMYFS